MMARSGWFWVRFWTAWHSLKLKAGGKERAQGRSGSASAERAWRKTYCVEVDFAYPVQIQRVHLGSERPGEKSGLPAQSPAGSPKAKILDEPAKTLFEADTLNVCLV